MLDVRKTMLSVFLYVLLLLGSRTAYAASGTIVYDNATVDARISVDSGKTLTIVLKGTNRFNAGITVPYGSTLIIEGDGSMVATGRSLWASAIGSVDCLSGNRYDCGTIIINGGNITANCGYYGAAIGGDSFERIEINGGVINTTHLIGARTNGGVLEINGGEITINSGHNGVYVANNGSLIMNDGTVNISGGFNVGFGGGNNSEITINGGSVRSHGNGNGGAAVGGGNSNKLTINGGTVTAICNTVLGSGGAAIGGRANHTVTINGGTVYAKAGYYGASIGGNAGVDGGTININGGNVTVVGSSNDGAAIGGGQNANGGNVTITGGTITATWETRYRDYYPALIGKGYGGSSDGTLTVAPAAYSQITVKSGTDASSATPIDGSPFVNNTSGVVDYKVATSTINSNTYVAINPAEIYVPKLVAYTQNGKLAILEDEEINIMLQLFINDVASTSMNGYSVEISDPEVLRLSKTREEDGNYIFTFTGLQQGTTYITFTENDTGASVRFIYEVIDSCNYYTCEHFLKTKEYELVGSMLCISQFRCSVDENNIHHISFYAFNRSHTYGVAGVFDKNGDFLTCEPIAPFASVGSGLEILWNDVYYVMVLLDDDPWYEKFVKLSQYTKIELLVPEESEVVVTLDGSEYRLGDNINLYTGIDSFLRLGFAAQDYFELDPEAVTVLVEDLLQNMDTALLEKLLKDISLAMADGLSSENIVDIFHLIQAAFEGIAVKAGTVDVDAYLNDLLVNSGVKLAENILTIGIPELKLLFFVGDVTELVMQAKNYNDCLYGPELEIDVREHTRLKNTLTDHSVTIEQDDYFEIDTVLDAYLVIENQELKQFPSSLTADMLRYNIYSITLRKNGKEIQPDGDLTIRIPVPKGANGENCVVYRLEKDNTRTKMDAVSDGDFMVFTTSHLSYYLVGEPYATHTVKWLNHDGSELEVDEHVPYGTMPEYNGEEPTKTADAQYTYTFTGWAPAIEAVTGDATYTAQFSNDVNSYTVTWVNHDGTLLETDENVAYGATPEYNGETPTRAADAQYTYIFKGWEPAVDPVTGNVTYKATYTETINTYTVKWLNHDGSELEVDEHVPYGTMPEYNGEEPTRTADAQYTYTFTGWAPAIEAVTGDATYTATFTNAANVYNVTVHGGNGSGEYMVGATVSISANTPADGMQFVQWSGIDGLTIALGTENTTCLSFIMPAREVTISAEYEAKVVAVTGVVLNEHQLNLTVGDTFMLIAMVLPADASNMNVSWSNSDAAVATFTEGALARAVTTAPQGLVTARTVGTTVITVTTEDGAHTDSCTVVVTEAPQPLKVTPAEAQNATVLEGETGELSVSASGGTAPYRYQWYVDRGTGFVPYEGSNAATHTTAPVELTNDGFRYFCRVTDTDGQTADSAIFTLEVQKVPQIPETGDNRQIGLWMTMCAISLIGIALLSRKRKADA